MFLVPTSAFFQMNSFCKAYFFLFLGSTYSLQIYYGKFYCFCQKIQTCHF